MFVSKLTNKSTNTSGKKIKKRNQSIEENNELAYERV